MRARWHRRLTPIARVVDPTSSKNNVSLCRGDLRHFGGDPDLKRRAPKNLHLSNLKDIDRDVNLTR